MTAAAHPKVIAFDLDGTLAESKQPMSADMGGLLGELLKKMPVAVMSGASFTQFEKQFFPALPAEANLKNLYLFPTNAASCYVHRNGVWHPQYDHSFNEAQQQEIHRALDEALAEVGLAEEAAQVWGPRVQDRGAQITFSAVGQEAPVTAKQAWAAAHNAKRKELRDILAAKLPNFSVSTGGISSVDITPKGITKAYGIHRLTELTGVSIPDILYVGDALEEGGNDAVVIETGVRTHAVFGPEETRGLIESMLRH